jgi:glutamate synthase domain-containing protein 2
MVAVGSYSAGTHIVHLDGGYGGTGAAPDIAKKNIAMPIEYAIVKVHNFLENEGIRDKVTLIASGGIRTSLTNDVTILPKAPPMMTPTPCRQRCPSWRTP